MPPSPRPFLHRNANHVGSKETRFSGWFPCQRRIRLASRSGLGRRDGQRLGGEKQKTGRRILHQEKKDRRGRRNDFSLRAPSIHIARRGTMEHQHGCVSLQPRRCIYLPSFSLFLSFFLSSSVAPSPAPSSSLSVITSLSLSLSGSLALSLAVCKVKRSCGLGSLAATRRDPVRALGH